MMSLKRITASMLAFVLATTAITSATVWPATVCAASKIKLNKETATIKVGKTVQLKVKGTKKKVKWSSSNTYVAKVTKKGKVIGKHVGSAKITAKVDNKKLTCRLKVKRKGKTVFTTTPKKTSTPIITKIPTMPTNTSSVTEIPSVQTKTPVKTEIPFVQTQTPVKTEIPSVQTQTPVQTKTPYIPTKNPIATEIPPMETTPVATEVPGKQVELALNFYLEEYNPEAPSAQFINVHLVNHLTEDVYLETEAYLTTKGKDYPAMIFGSKEGDLKKISPTNKEDTYGEMVTYDSKEYVMGNYTDETFWLTSDENSKLTFYFRIGEKRYKAVIDYNETGAVFREASDDEVLLPIVTETPSVPTKTPITTEIPPMETTPVATEVPGKQVELALNFYLEEYNPEAPSAQFINVHLVNHLTEDVYLETEAYLTTKGKDYPAMIFGSKEGDLKKISPTNKEDTYGEMVTYDSKEYVMGNYTDETFWLTSDENSKLTFYFRIGEKRYKAVIDYNETGAVFREASDDEVLLPIVTKTPITSEQPVVTNTPEQTLEPVEMPFKFYIQEPTGMIQNGTEASTDYFPIAFESEELVTVKVEKGAMITINGKTYPLYTWSEESLTLSGGDMELYVVPLFTRSMEDEIEFGELYVPYECNNTVLSFYFEMNGNRYKAEATADKNACKYYKVD